MEECDVTRMTERCGRCRRVTSHMAEKYLQDFEAPISGVISQLALIPGPTDGLPGSGRAEQLLVLRALQEKEESPTLFRMVREFVERLPPELDYVGDHDNPLAWYVMVCKDQDKPYIPQNNLLT